eukprot:scaffold709_cov142-Skeletonema_menzelii.AAC.4
MNAAVKSESDTKTMCCASCGIAGGGDIILKKCDDCDLVKYCSIKCQKEHGPKHKEECKKRAAELYDELLFQQPESTHYGDCPICCLPLSIDPKKSGLYSCCSKQICRGCNYANTKRELEGKLQEKCPFCRKAMPETDEEFNKQLMKRVGANDPFAMCQMGTERYKAGDYNAAFEYWTKAAALGDVEAHFNLSILYRDGQGVEKDEERALHHSIEAAIAGHPNARYNLACVEEEYGRVDRAVKHYIIAAKLGHDKSLESVKNLYKAGFVSKDDFAAALRGHQAAIDATKSPQREEAAELAKRLCAKGRVI